MAFKLRSGHFDLPVWFPLCSYGREYYADGSLSTDDQLLPSFDDARSSVDALIGDTTTEDYGQSFAALSQVSRCLNPLFPPGFGLSSSYFPVERRADFNLWPAGRVMPMLAPFTPQRSLSSIGRSLTQLPLFSGSSRTNLTQSAGLSFIEEKKEAKSQTGSLKLCNAKSDKSPLQDEDFPALEAGKGKTTSPSRSQETIKASSTIANQKTLTVASVASEVSRTSSETQSTQNMDASVPKKISHKRPPATEPCRQNVAFPRLPSNTPPSANLQTPRNIPKTLRLTSASKQESSVNLSATASTVSSVPPSQLPISRQPSVVSNIRLASPGTPTSEIISDNASVTSTSFSRASSPPPTRVGSAPVRATTKSSQKKQRQVQKEKERVDVETTVTIEPEVEIGPITGRKKKQKKERTHINSGGTVPFLGKPQTQGKLTESTIENHTVEEKTGPEVKKLVSGPDTSQTVPKTLDPKVSEKDKTQMTTAPDLNSLTAEFEDESVTKPPTPAAIFQSFLSSGVIKDVNELYLLKNVSSSYRHTDILDKLSKKETSPKLTITPEDHETLLAGKPVHKISEGGHRVLLTPNGDCVRNLTEEEENRYLEYQARLAKNAGPTTFVSTKYSGQNGFTMIGGRAVPSGPPSFFPSPKKENNIDAVSKIQRDEALNYINQYVLPTLSSNTQLDKTFSPNATHGELMRSGSVDSAWRSWGTERASISSGNTDFCMNHSPNGEGMIENITTHFAIGEIDRQANCSLLSLSDAESAMQIARKEADGLEKRLNALIKKNRRLLLGSGH